MGEGLAEEVLVVPRSVLETVGIFQGFCGEVDRYLPALLDPANTSWRTRAVVEEDPSFKQLIPYCVLRWQSDDGEKTMCALRGLNPYTSEKTVADGHQPTLALQVNYPIPFFKSG